MPLTITDINIHGEFNVMDEKMKRIGGGVAKASKTMPGMVTLLFSPSVLPNLNRGIRIPINWLELEVKNEV